MWGEYYPSRRETYGEVYIKIPANVAYDSRFLITTILLMLIAYTTVHHNHVSLLAQGNQSNDIYAKQFAEEGNLKGVATGMTTLVLM